VLVEFASAEVHQYFWAALTEDTDLATSQFDCGGLTLTHTVEWDHELNEALMFFVFSVALNIQLAC